MIVERICKLISFIYLTFLGYFLVVSYITPQSFTIPYIFNCTSTSCTIDASEEQKVKVESDLEKELDIANRIGEFSKPFSEFVRFIPRVTNKSMKGIDISDPKKSLRSPAFISCLSQTGTNNTFSYDSGMVFDQKTKLSDIATTTRNIEKTLTGCFPANQSMDGEGSIIHPQGIVSFVFDTKYLVEYIPDTLSRVLIYLLSFLFWLGLLPVLREGFRFVMQENYFGSN